MMYVPVQRIVCTCLSVRYFRLTRSTVVCSVPSLTSQNWRKLSRRAGRKNMRLAQTSTCVGRAPAREDGTTAPHSHSCQPVEEGTRLWRHVRLENGSTNQECEGVVFNAYDRVCCVRWWRFVHFISLVVHVFYQKWWLWLFWFNWLLNYTNWTLVLTVRIFHFHFFRV